MNLIRQPEMAMGFSFTAFLIVCIILGKRYKRLRFLNYTGPLIVTVIGIIAVAAGDLSYYDPEIKSTPIIKVSAAPPCCPAAPPHLTASPCAVPPRLPAPLPRLTVPRPAPPLSGHWIHPLRPPWLHRHLVAASVLPQRAVGAGVGHLPHGHR